MSDIPEPLDARTYYELKAFYAGHLATRDEGNIEAWLGSFDADSTLTTNVLDRTTAMAKETFTPKVHQLDAQFARAGVQRRHEASTFVFTRNPDGTISARFYTVLLASGRDGTSRVHSTTVATDRIRRDQSGWRVLSREIRRDDLPWRDSPRREE